MDPALFELLEHVQPADETELLVKLKDPDRPPAELRVVCTFGDIVTGRARADELKSVWASERCISVKAPRHVHEELLGLPFSEAGVHARARALVRRPQLPENGRGVIIAFLDWGFDVAHPNFRNADGTTRLLALWHQSADGGGDLPNPYGYGAMHSRSAIDAALASADPYAALSYHPADADTELDGTHGTHVADIAAGNGRLPDSLVGVAPAAELLFIDLSTDAVPGQVGVTLGDSVRVLEAIDFVCRTAQGRPWVANLSLGAMGGPHDARTLVEQAMDKLLERELNAAIVCSCGNYYDAATHAAGQLRPAERRTLRWRIHPEDRTPNELEIWYAGIDRFALELKPPAPDMRFAAELGGSARIELPRGEVGRMYHRPTEPNTNDNHIDIFLDVTAPAGEWEVTLIGRDVMDGRFDGWIERDGSALSAQSRFHEAEVMRECTIGTICTGYRTLAVGAYDAHQQQRPIAPFSSAGFTRDGRQKPELVAPGVAVLAARSTPRDGRPGVTTKSGTSMAAPHVSGTVALMFQAAPRPLKIWETRALLLGNVQSAVAQDPRRFGAGYLDSEAAVNAARAAPVEVLRSPSSPAPPLEEAIADGVIMEESVPENTAWSDSSVERIMRFAEQASSGNAQSAPARLLAELHRLSTALSERATTAQLQVVASAQMPLADVRRGDVILIDNGRGLPAAAAVIATEQLLPFDALAPARLRPLDAGAGWYAHVIELGAAPRTLGERVARRLTDSAGRLLPNHQLIRLASEPRLALRFPDSAGIVTHDFRIDATEAQPLLDASAIRYLAFEGGGGKGFAFLGAIEALETLGILARRQDDTGLLRPVDGGRIAGVSGSSAGAITALLVSCGFSSGQILSILGEDFTRFYDPPRPGVRVYAGYGPVEPRGVAAIGGFAAPIASQILNVVGGVVPQLLALLSTNLDPPFDRLADPSKTLPYVECLRSDFGFFDGWQARQFFDQKLQAALARLSGRPQSEFRNASFARHYEITGIKLAVAGANLSTRRSELFSVDTTPTMAVADAVRISMGFPFAFKPVLIVNPAQQGITPAAASGLTAAELTGFWVDGGLLNNLPLQAFGGETGNTLGLRLDIDEPNYAISHLGGFIAAFFRTLMSAGESHITSSWRTAQRTIALNTKGLSLFDFAPDRRIAEARIDEARATVLARFPHGARFARTGAIVRGAIRAAP